jgi:hypothetical protein
MIKLEFYVPEENADKVKTAVFEAGAGRIGSYDCCCWETTGTGQFRPLEGSTPYIGEQGKVERIKELKIEMVCADNLIENVISALKSAHPYETPAYQYWKVKG